MHEDQVGESLAMVCQLGGKWSKKEKNLQINVLELIAVRYMILTFTKAQSNTI